MPLFGERNGAGALRFWRQPAANTREVGKFLAGTNPCVFGIPCPEEGFYLHPQRPVTRESSEKAVPRCFQWNRQPGEAEKPGEV